MKNETGLHFLGWAILANVSSPELLAVGCMMIAGGYAVLGLIQTFRDDR